MKLKALSKSDCEQVRQWRNECLVALRTPYPLTEEQQARFYETVVCDRNARARYWGITVNDKNIWDNQFDKLIGMCGLENIEWENRRAEISIILNPECQGKGYGEKAVELLLKQGFNYLNLENIWGECYENNPAITFWQKIIIVHNGYGTAIPCTKYFNGEYFGSLHFTLFKNNWTTASTKKEMDV